MSAEQLAEANAPARPHPPLVGLALSRSLGFIVIGRLAARIRRLGQLTASPSPHRLVTAASRRGDDRRASPPRSDPPEPWKRRGPGRPGPRCARFLADAVPSGRLRRRRSTSLRGRGRRRPPRSTWTRAPLAVEPRWRGRAGPRRPHLPVDEDAPADDAPTSCPRGRARRRDTDRRPARPPGPTTSHRRVRLPRSESETQPRPRSAVEPARPRSVPVRDHAALPRRPAGPARRRSPTPEGCLSPAGAAGPTGARPRRS